MDDIRPDATARGDDAADDARWSGDPPLDAPAPPAGFVEATLSRILGDPDVRLSVLLAAYRVPAPSPGFVTRVLARVADPATPAPRAMPRWPLFLAAAALLLAAGLWLGRGASSPERVPTYPSFSAALGQHAARHPHADAPPLDGFFRTVSFAEQDGLAILAGGPR